MIDQLVKYAVQEQLVSEPGFKSQTIRWALDFTADGQSDWQYLGLLPIGGEEGYVFPKSPELTQPEHMRLKGGSKFLYETAAVVALFGNIQQKEGIKHDFFVNLLRKVSEHIPELQLLAVANALDDANVLHKIQDDLKQNKVKPTEKVTLRVNGRFVLEDPRWHPWWRRFRGELQAGGHRDTMICFATGEPVVPALTHPKVRGLADVGRLRESSLVGFDKDSFVSYGLEQSRNAAVSEEGAAAYRAALEHLLQSHCKRLAGTKVVYWYSHSLPSDVDDPLAFLFDSDSNVAAFKERSALDRARNLLNYLDTGSAEATELRGNIFYVLTVSGAGGRVMVRDWAVGSFEQLAQNVANWFDSLQIVRFDGGGPAPDPGFERVVTCLLPLKPPSQNYADWVSALSSVRTRLLDSALLGERLPADVLGRILFNHNRFLLSGRLSEAISRGNAGVEISTLHARMGLLKAYHIKNKGDIHMKVSLNKEHPSVAYQCGRLLAIYSRLQEAALGDVGAGVVQRFYAAACATPALVLARLDRTARFHLNSLRETGLQRWYLDQLTEVWNRIPERPPRTLNLEDQSLFALGYYHQLAEMRSPKSNASQINTQ